MAPSTAALAGRANFIVTRAAPVWSSSAVAAPSLGRRSLVDQCVRHQHWRASACISMGPSPPDLDCRAKHNRAQVIGANFYRKVGRRRRYGVSKSYSDSEPSCGQDPTVFSDDNSFNMEKLMGTASQKTTPLSLQNMYRYASVGKPAQRLRNAQFLHNELPIRMAQRAVDLLTLPHGLNNTRQVRSVANVYMDYLNRFQDIPAPQNADEERDFTDVLRGFVLDRTSIPAAIAAGISTLKDRRREDLDVRRLREMEEALYRFFTARVGLRFLTEHHILSDDRREVKEDLRKQTCLEDVPLEPDQEDDFLGCIQKNCDPVREARRVADQVIKHCNECYGIAPVIDIVDATRKKDARVDFTYVPHHLQYMLSELLKNSCRASVRK